MNAINLGSTDCALRLVIGVALVLASTQAEGAWRWLALPGLTLALSGTFRVCLVYRLLRLDTTGDDRVI